MRGVSRFAVLALALFLAACSAVQVRESARRETASAATLCVDLESARKQFEALVADPGNVPALEAYNAATERVVEALFEASGRGSGFDPGACGITAELSRITWPSHLIAASRLEMRGLRRIHAREGIGASFVAARSRRDEPQSGVAATLVEPAAIATTYVLRFEGKTAAMEAYDPIRQRTVWVGETDVPLAANFSAPYALWLAGAHLGRVGDRALFVPTSRLAGPRIHLMHPYDPAKRTIVMLHGLGSSPEAFLDLVNDILGDDELRDRYQIWQVFYPTGLPIPENRRTIRGALVDAFAILDPAGGARASRDVTLIGHSMGGVLARLLVVESGERLWRAYFEDLPDAQSRERLAPFAPYLDLAPLPGVRRAIFIAAPHRGSPVAASWLGRASSRLVRLPKSVGATVASLADAVASVAPGRDRELRSRPMDSIHGLRDSDRYLHRTSDLPIAPHIAFHSIIGRQDEGISLADSDDGTVPYSSAHLEAAESELVVTSGHDVPANPEAIREVLRILRIGAAAAR